MKILRLLFVLLLFSPLFSLGQSLTLVDTVQFNFINANNGLGDVGGSDCWGYTAPDGTEYAIMGTLKGIGIVNAQTRQVIDELVGPDQNDGYYHRDMVTYGHYLYCVAEMRGTREGLMIVDLSYLPDSVHYVKSFINGFDITSHNMDIDSATGFAYVVKDAYDGVRLIDLADPENPVETGLIPGSDIHDVYARNDTAWIAEGYQKAYSVWDCSDKANPTLIARITDPDFGYCHNIWPSDNGKIFITTEETPFKTVKFWDMSNPASVILRGEYIAPNQLAHNVQVMGDHVFIAHYTSGITVVDFSDPDNPLEVGAYDCYAPNDTAWYGGTWGCYPYTQNGYVYGSNFEGTLYILNWDPLQISRKEFKERQFSLGQNYPNPVMGETVIPFELKTGTRVKLELFNAQGQLIEVLAEGLLPAGKHEVNWQSQEAGAYFFRLTTPEGAVVKRLMVVGND